MGRKQVIMPDDKAIKTIHGLGVIQATTREVAAVLGVSHQTLMNTFKKFPELREQFENGKEMGKSSLRRCQFNLAKRNATMAIWLGKQYLEQTDKQEISGPDGGAIRIERIENVIVDPVNNSKDTNT